MASIANVYPPNHPPPSISSTINSGSDGSDRPSRYRLSRSPSYDEDEHDDGFSLIIHRTEGELNEYMREQRLLRANQDNAVSRPFSNDSSLFQGNSAPNDSEDENMTEEEFFAQLGEDTVPDWAYQPLEAAPQVEGDGSGDDSMELSVEDLEAQLSAETTTITIPDDDFELMELSAENFEAQRNAAAAAADSDDEARQAELDAEIGKEPVVDLVALAEKERRIRQRRKARRDRARKRRVPGKRGMRNFRKPWYTPPKAAAPETRLEQGDNMTAPTTDELEAELEAELMGDGLIDFTTEDLEAELAGEADAGSVVDGTVGHSSAASSEIWARSAEFKRNTVDTVLKTRKEKAAEKRAKKRNLPLGQRLGRSRPPPMRKTDALPKLYHHQNPIDWTSLRKAVTLSTRVELNTCYKALGLDVGRGRAVYEDLKKHLRIPGNSVNLSSDNVEPNAAKRIVARMAHRLLVNEGWGQKYFNRPSLESGCKYIPFDSHSTEVFLEFTSLVYKAIKLEEKRKKGKAKTQEIRDAAAVVQHQAAQNLAATTYQSPRAVVAQPLPSAPAPAAQPTPVAPPGRLQTVVNGAILAPRSVAPVAPNDGGPLLLLSLLGV